MMIAMILVSVISKLQQRGYLPPAELGARLATPPTRNTYYWVQTEEEREAASVRMLHRRELQASFAGAVYRRDNASARVKLYETLDTYGQAASFSHESLLKLPTDALTMAGDYCLNAGDLDGAVIVADVLREKTPLQDSLLFIEFVRIKSGASPTAQSDIARDMIMSYSYSIASDFRGSLDATMSSARETSLVHIARGLVAEYEWDLDRSAFHYERALALDESSPFCKFFYSRVLLDTGAKERARGFLKEVATSPYPQLAERARDLLLRVGG